MINQLRPIIRNRVLDILSIGACPAKGIHILNGHRISLAYPDGNIFYNLLLQLSSLVEFINFDEAVRLINTRTSVDKSYVAFSFDDGLEECYTHIAPVLDAFNIKAAFFINPNFVEANDEYIRNMTCNVLKMPNKMPMNWTQIKDLYNRGHIIGAHTLDHIDINQDNDAFMDYQIGHCKHVIQHELNNNCEYFAFPFGRLSHANNKSIDIASKYYKYIFSQSDYKNYYSFDGKVINRRHFEPDWSFNHIKYFLSCIKKYPLI